MGVPGADDIMLNYQTTSFHDALYVRQVLGLRPAPEFEAWLQTAWRSSAGRAVSGCADRLPPAFRRRCCVRWRATAMKPVTPVTADPWQPLRRFTAGPHRARPRRRQPADGPHLEFQLAHAQARDAVHLALDAAALGAALSADWDTSLLAAQRRRRPHATTCSAPTWDAGSTTPSRERWMR